MFFPHAEAPKESVPRSMIPASSMASRPTASKAGSISFTFFFYIFVNTGMVTGLLTNGRRLSDRAYLDGLLEVRALGVTRVGASRTQEILDECKRRLG